MSLPIEPGTKVGALLEAYPGIEEHLIAWVPAFSKLRNPILRKTVARVATLEQAARIGGVSVRDLVRKLRAAAGQDESEAVQGPAGPPDTAADERPFWVCDERVRYEIDADRMLETGEHPIGRVRQCAESLETGEIVRLTSSFRPAPLIDTLQRSGLAVFSAEAAPGRHATYICRRPPQA
jgi:hypothetical protein